jgi:hypothetical protein
MQSAAETLPRPHTGRVTEEPPYVKAPEPIPVLVTHDDGLEYPGWVTGWRGERVDVEYSVAVGMKHMLWLPAERVRRLSSG